MADYASAQPIRTENAGDVIVKLADGTTPSQQLAIDSSGRVIVKIQDGAGNAITSQASGSQQALDVGINVSGVQIDPRAIRALTSSDVVTAAQGAAAALSGAWSVKLTDGTTAAAISGSGELSVKVTSALPAGTNNIGKVSIQDSSGSAFSVSNPLPVTISDSIAGATEVLDHKKATSVAANASDTHTYTISSGKTFTLQKIAASASGKIKVEIKLGTIGSEASKVVLFNSASSPNVEYEFKSPQEMADTTDVLVVITNLDKAAQDVYSTVEGYEV